MASETKSWQPRAVAAALAALVGWVFWNRYRFLAASPYPLGIDGYFYPIQLRSILESGATAYTGSIGPWLMAPLAAVTDPITGAKLAAALGGALLAVPVYMLGKRVAGGDRAVGLLAAVLVATSAESFYLSTEFVNNGLALTLAATYLCGLARALDEPTERRIGIAAALLLVTALTHKTGAAFAVLASIGPLWIYSRRRALQVLALVAVAAAAAGALAPHRFLGAADLALVGDMFTGAADWSMPALALPGRSLHFAHEVAIAGALAVAALAIGFTRHRGDRNRALVIGPAFVALLAAIPWLDTGDHQGLAFRIRLLSFLPLALCGALVASELLRASTPVWRKLAPDMPSMASAVVALGFAAGLIAARPWTSDEGVLYAHPSMQAAVRAVDVPEDGVVIIPERHILYMVTWYTRIPARLEPDPVPAGRRWRLLPGAHLDPHIRNAIDAARSEPDVPGARPRSLHPGDRNGLVLIQESTWTWIVERLPGPSREHYAAWPTI